MSSMIRDPKEVLKEVVERVGKRAARELLLNLKVNPSTAEKLVGERYEWDIGFLLLQKIYRAHEITFKKEKSA